MLVSRNVSSTHPAALTALQALAFISGLGNEDIAFVADPAVPLQGDDFDCGTMKIEMTVSVYNSFNAVSSSYTANGMLGCARIIGRVVPESGLFGHLKGSTDFYMVESWIETAATVLCGPAYFVSDGQVKDPHYKNQVEEFVNTVESHLFSTSSTFLLGGIATSADVVISILLADSMARTGVTKVPQQVRHLLEIILNNPVLVKAVGKMAIPFMGDASPFKKSSPPKEGTKANAPLNESKVISQTIPEKKAMNHLVYVNKDARTEIVPARDSTTVRAPSSSFGYLAHNPVVRKLNELFIPHTTYLHDLSKTAEELVVKVPLPPSETHTKTLVLQDKKHGIFLVSVKMDSDINIKKLGKSLNLGSKVDLRLANETILMEYFGVKTGCVGPLCILNVDKKEVTLVLDERLFASEVTKIHSPTLTNIASTALLPDDMRKYVKAVGFKTVMLPFETREGETSRNISANHPLETKKHKQLNNVLDRGPKMQLNKKKNKRTTQKGDTLLALQWKKDENFAMWYSDVIILSEMISYYDISGCYILRPWSYKIWELIQNWFNVEIQKLGVENSYFPLFVSQVKLEKEKDHVKGFAPEVAWVTKSGDGTLTKPIAVRPTSETIMYPAFSDWIKSHRDLPLKLNQWSNVIRWEFSDPTPFLRSREFLWQEGHTVHVSNDDANVMVKQALELYRRVYEEILAVPVIPGFKTEKEKFAGSHQTTTVEAYIAGSGRAIQGATSHNLGQNFGKMFDITFQDENGKSQIVWQTSWGLTTRSIGVMIMVHGDDAGLVLPPRISPLQAVIVPIISKRLTYKNVDIYCECILNDLKNNGVRTKYDDRVIYNPGWKYNHWEQKGVPIRIEVGPRDIEQNMVRVVFRYNREKIDLPIKNLGAVLKDKLEIIQTAMFEKAKTARDQHLVQVLKWKDFVPNLEKNNIVLTPWCGGDRQDWEIWVKEKSRNESLHTRGLDREDSCTAISVAAKALCIPFTQPELPEGTKCFASDLPAKCWCLWGRSY